MNRTVLGILLGILWGVADVLMTVGHPGITTFMLLQAFTSRFAVGFLGVHVLSIPLHPVLSGALVGLLVSLPDAFALNSFPGILGTGLLFGALTGWAGQKWARSK